MNKHVREKGFSMTELMIVIAIIAIVAAISVPKMLSARIRANESVAIATLKSISTAQVQCQSSASVDVDHDGVGEFGFLAELGGHAALRGPGGLPSNASMAPALVTIAGKETVSFLGTGRTGFATRKSGYYFALFLPSSTSEFVPEADHGGATAANHPDPTQSEVLWCAYAWPTSLGFTGSRCFFINQAGEVLSAANTGALRYGGKTNAPNPGAAFLGKTTTVRMNSTIAANASGQDGQLWRVVD